MLGGKEYQYGCVQVKMDKLYMQIGNSHSKLDPACYD